MASNQLLNTAAAHRATARVTDGTKCLDTTHAIGHTSTVTNPAAWRSVRAEPAQVPQKEVVAVFMLAVFPATMLAVRISAKLMTAAVLVLRISISHASRFSISLLSKALLQVCCQTRSSLHEQILQQYQ